MNGAFFNALLKNERRLIIACIALLTVLSWWYLVSMDMMATMITGAWVPADWWAVFLMWAIMMVAMMLPSATPMILMYAVISPLRQPNVSQFASNQAFLLGYLLAWTGFSVLATLTQWLLQNAQMLTPMLASNSSLLTICVLILAGLYQWSALKNTCLEQCRSPVEHLSQHWRAGLGGALRMGFQHGLFCLGCCWLLMLLLFAGGVMNLALITALAIFVLLEKVLPARWQVSRVSGSVLLGAGVALAVL